jgi:GntR family transcriptional regulator, transcriptional repressor for pyruvate dehydrogenase complex
MEAQLWGQHSMNNRVQKLCDIVASDILHRIVSEGIGVGSRLPPEPQMVAEYGVGRATVREALRILESHGIIRLALGPKGGPIVATNPDAGFQRGLALHLHFRQTTLRQLVQTRLLIEPAMAWAAAESATPELIERLNNSIEVTARDSKVSEQHYKRTTQRFHETICTFSDNPAVNLIADGMRSLWEARSNLLRHAHEAQDSVIHDHQEIAQAIGDKAPADAHRLMSAHMLRYAEWVESTSPGALDELVGWRAGSTEFLSSYVR